LRFLSSRALGRLANLSLLMVAGCGGNPVDPSPPTLALSCPASITVEATQPGGATATFEQPAARDGRPPYRIDCAPGSGSDFPSGETRVNCTATDSEQTQAACSFNVIVGISQRLAKIRFLSFGDSITGGTVSPALTFLDNPDSYPYKLEHLLRGRYPAQEIVVLNRGVGGERLQQGAARLPGVLDADRPEVLLLFEGIISVRQIPTATNAQHLRTMVSAARQRGIDVMMATVMPVGAGLEAKEPGINAAVVRLNVEIRKLAQEFALGEPVDLYALFQASPQLIGRDNLHPTQEGFTRIAEKFNEAVIARYDIAAP
jgi:lysophospholipase L1-like esterase